MRIALNGGRTLYYRFCIVVISVRMAVKHFSMHARNLNFLFSMYFSLWANFFETLFSPLVFIIYRAWADAILALSDFSIRSVFVCVFHQYLYLPWFWFLAASVLIPVGFCYALALVWSWAEFRLYFIFHPEQG